MKLSNMVTVFCVMILFGTFLQAQTAQDVVYLKNGSIVKGIVVEQIINKSIKVRTKDDNVFVFEWNQIERIAKEDAAPAYNAAPTPPPTYNPAPAIQQPGQSAPTAPEAPQVLPPVANPFYIVVGGSYNSSDLSDRFDVDSYNGSSWKSTKREFKSYGAGIGFEAGLGYVINSIYSFEFNIKSITGTPIEVNEKHGTGNSTTGTNTKEEPSAIIIIPTLVINLPKMNPTTTPFVKAGLLIGLPEIKTSYNYYSGTNVTSIEELEDGGVAYGYRFELGLKLNIAANMDLFGSLDFNALHYKPEKVTLKKYSLNGISHLDDITDKESKYKESISADDEDNVQLQPSYGFSSIGIHVGLQYKF